jgi:hypothetical protein
VLQQHEFEVVPELQASFEALLGAPQSCGYFFRSLRIAASCAAIIANSA